MAVYSSPSRSTKSTSICKARSPAGDSTVIALGFHQHKQNIKAMHNMFIKECSASQICKGTIVPWYKSGGCRILGDIKQDFSVKEKRHIEQWNYNSARQFFEERIDVTSLRKKVCECSCNKHFYSMYCVWCQKPALHDWGSEFMPSIVRKRGALIQS